MPSVKKNFFYSSIITVSNYLFPLITFPYTSRVLGVSNIGICNYVDSIVNYFVLFSMLGISTVGIRAIAETKNDKNKLSKAFSSLLVFNSITTLLGLTILILGVLFLDQLQPYRQFLYVGILKFLSTFLCAEWFYKGMEDFKYITARTMFVKCTYVVLVFICVHDSSDAIIYYILSMLMVSINAAFNIVHTRKYIRFTIKGINPWVYATPIITFGSYIILTSFYNSFNVTYLGWKTNPTQVGYYATATKLYSMIIAVFTAFTGVMLPRMTNLLAEGKKNEFLQYISKSQNLLITFAVPTIMFAMVFAPFIIRILAGDGYDGAIIPMLIILPLVFVIGYEQILVVQTLNPLKKDKIILRNSIYAAILGLVLNIVLVPYFQSIGSAISWVAPELLILIISQYYVKKFVGLVFPWKQLIYAILYNLPLVALYVLVYHIFHDCVLVTIAVMGLIMVAYTLILQYYLNNEFVVSFVNKYIKKNV